MQLNRLSYLLLQLWQDLQRLGIERSHKACEELAAQGNPQRLVAGGLALAGAAGRPVQNKFAALAYRAALQWPCCACCRGRPVSGTYATVVLPPSAYRRRCLRRQQQPPESAASHPCRAPDRRARRQLHGSRRRRAQCSPRFVVSRRLPCWNVRRFPLPWLQQLLVECMKGAALSPSRLCSTHRGSTRLSPAPSLPCRHPRHTADPHAQRQLHGSGRRQA